MDSIDEQIQKRKEFLEKCEKERKEKELQTNVATFTPQVCSLIIYFKKFNLICYFNLIS